MNELLSRIYFHNSIRDYLIASAIIIVGLSVIRILKRFIFERIKGWLKGSSSVVDDYVFSGIDRFGFPVMYFLVFYFGVHYLEFTPGGIHIIDIATTVIVTFLILRMVSSMMLILLRSYIRKQENGEEKIRQMDGLMMIITFIIWILGLIFLFDNLGYDVTAVVTGLGIGGIAVALAAQNILGDLFNYFVIFLDRPFEVNDFITIDQKQGTVEHIGIKTTRLKSLGGEQLIFANGDLTSSRIHNFKRMERRRAVLKFTVGYQTPVKKLEIIPALLKRIVDTQELALVDRSHLALLADSGVIFELVFYVLSSEYSVYMDILQAINLTVLREFEAIDVELVVAPRTLPVLPANEENKNKGGT